MTGESAILEPMSSPVIVVADSTGTVVYVNRAARERLGLSTGAKCWRTLGALDDAVGLPCKSGCVQRLLAGGAGHARSTDVHLADGRHHLVCASVGGEAVCALSRLGEAREPWHRVTPRELDVLRRLALGDTTEQIAVALDVSASTVRTHIEHLRRRFDVSTRAGLVGRGYQLGLL